MVRFGFSFLIALLTMSVLTWVSVQAKEPFPMPDVVKCANGNFIDGISDNKSLRAARRNFIQARKEMFQAMGRYLETHKAELGIAGAAKSLEKKWSGKLRKGYGRALKIFNEGARECNFKGNLQTEAATSSLHELVFALNGQSDGPFKLGDASERNKSRSYSENLPLRMPPSRNLAVPYKKYKQVDPESMRAYYYGVCKKKYGNRFARLSYANGRYTCHYNLPTKQRLKIAWRACRKKYGKRLSRVTLNKKGSVCHYRRSTKARLREARRRCRKKYGRALSKVRISKNRIICHYRRRLSKKQAWRSCRRKYGKRLVRLRKRRGKYVCVYRK